jgi:hypothetical protein
MLSISTLAERELLESERIILTEDLLSSISQYPENYSGKTIIIPHRFLDSRKSSSRVNTLTTYVIGCRNKTNIHYIVMNIGGLRYIDKRIRLMLQQEMENGNITC